MPRRFLHGPQFDSSLYLAFAESGNLLSSAWAQTALTGSRSKAAPKSERLKIETREKFKRGLRLWRTKLTKPHAVLSAVDRRG